MLSDNLIFNRVLKKCWRV